MEIREKVLYIDEFIRMLESEFLIVLTPGARQMLAIPILEEYQPSSDEDLDGMKQSIETIMRSMIDENVDVRDRVATIGADKQIRSSFSVVRAYAKLFCRIPPFCGPRTHG